MKNVLIVKMSPYDELSSSNIRTFALIKGFVDLDFNVELLTIHSRTNQVNNTYINSQFMDKVSVKYANANELYDSINKTNFKLLKILLKMAKKIYHLFSMFDYTKNIADNVDISLLNSSYYDYIVSVSDPKTSHLAVSRLIKLGVKYGKWIEYWGDPLYGDISKSTLISKRRLLKAERKMFNICDKIIYTSPFTLEEQRSFHGDFKNKMFYYPTPYVAAKTYAPTYNNMFSIGYFGAYYKDVRDVSKLYFACSQLPNVKLVIAGDSDINLISQSNIVVSPRCNVENMEKESDLLVCLLNRKGSQLPGKLYYYAATNKPILVILDGGNREKMNDFLKSFDRYYLCDNNEVEIKKKIVEIMKDDKKFKPLDLLNPDLFVRKILS